MEQPGLDNRHRDKNGQIARKHGNALIATLRQTYGTSRRIFPPMRSSSTSCTSSTNHHSPNWSMTLMAGRKAKRGRGFA